MAIDYIIGGLQLLSAAVNVLALGAFWVTPGLRTTANRFVINLLVVNVIGCLALTPALWLHGGLTPEQMIHNENMPTFGSGSSSSSSDSGRSISSSSSSSFSSIGGDSVSPMPTVSAAASLSLHDEFGNGDVKLIKSMSTRLECIEQIGSQRCDTVLIEQEDNVVNNNNNNVDEMAEIVGTKRVLTKNDVDDEVEIVEEVREEAASVVHELNGDGDNSVVKGEREYSGSSEEPTKNILYSDCTRFWGFDLVAALGGLSVVLVVGDTWCAITDPLRYHSRVSGLKSWILIASTWFISILFCIASAFRSDCRLITIKITSTLQNAYWRKTTSAASEQQFIESAEKISHEATEFNEIYNLIYSCTFFLVIILLPICLVCAMYWKIFSEARQNGLRMRQNGSSPLLQSALNLATVPSLPLDTGCSVIGEEEDSEDACVVTALPAMRRNSVASPHHVSINLNYSKPILMKMNASPGKMSRHVYHQQHRRYLEIPKFVTAPYVTTPPMSGGGDPTHHSSLSSMESTPSKSKCSFTSNALMQFDRYTALTADSAGNGDLRQVHSTPDLQKTINAELLAARRTVADHNKKIHSTGSIHTTFPVQPPSICTPPKALSYMTSIRHRLSNASSIFKYREESRAARISVLVVIMFLFSYFPYGLLVLLQGRVTFIANSSFLGVLFLLIASTSSPFIFAYRNRRVRRGVCRLFGVDAKTNERLQKQRILMRSATHSSSCRDGVSSKKSSKAKIVRINRNTAKSASFAAPTSHVPCKYTPPIIPMANKECIAPVNSDEFETDSFIAIPNDINCVRDSSDNDDDDSDGVGKIIIDQYVPIDEMDKSMRIIVSNNQNMPLDVNEFVRTHNTNSSSNNVIKQKISLLKRVCKTSRKLSNCTSDASIERIYYEGGCNQGTTPVNV